MSECEHWIAVDLTNEDLIKAELWAQGRQMRRTAARAAANRFTYERALDNHRVGILGELAVAHYENVIIPEDDWHSDQQRGYDVAGWSVRTRPKAHYGLGLHRNDHGRFLLVLAHDAPRLWLVGQITADQGFAIAALRHDGAYRDEREWWLVEQCHLAPLPEQNGYTHRGARWMIDPRTPFYDETCGGVHPIIEHRACRAVE